MPSPAPIGRDPRWPTTMNARPIDSGSTPGADTSTGRRQIRADRIVTWRPATVSEVIRETPAASTLALDVAAGPAHRAGQHVDIRLTAEDGYHAQRSYSLASAPEDGVPTITVERLDHGEVSPYLVDDAQVGDVVEIRGPVGGWFVWEASQGGPLWLIGGGSGGGPLRGVVRTHHARP